MTETAYQKYCREVCPEGFQSTERLEAIEDLLVAANVGSIEMDQRSYEAIRGLTLHAACVKEWAEQQASTVADLTARLATAEGALAEIEAVFMEADISPTIPTILNAAKAALERISDLERVMGEAKEALEKCGRHRCNWEFERVPHCVHCGKSEERHHSRYLSGVSEPDYLKGHCPDDRGRPEPTMWTPRPPLDCTCGLDAALASISALQKETK